MRKIIFILVVSLVAGFSALAVAVQSPRVWEKALLQGINNRWPDIALKSIAIERVHLSRQGILTLRHINARLKIKGSTYYLSTGHIQLSSLWSFSNLPIEIKHLAVVSDTINVSDLSLSGHAQFQRFNFKQLDAVLKAVAVEYNKYLLADMSTKLQADTKQAVLGDFNAGFYKGTLNGVIRVDYLPQLTYRVDMALAGIDIEELTKAMPALSSMKGIVYGGVKLQGQADQLIELNAQFNEPKGGQIKAEVLSYLAQYIPQRQQIEALIKDKADIFLDRADMRISSVSDKKLAAQIKLLSTKLNLDMNVTVDINIDDGFLSLLSDVKRLSK